MYEIRLVFGRVFSLYNLKNFYIYNIIYIESEKGVNKMNFPSRQTIHEVAQVLNEWGITDFFNDTYNQNRNREKVGMMDNHLKTYYDS